MRQFSFVHDLFEGALRLSDLSALLPRGTDFLGRARGGGKNLPYSENVRSR